MRNIFSATALSLLMAFSVPAAAWAQPVTKIQQFNAWGTYSYQAKDGKVCYVLSVPTAKKPANLDHGDIYFFVSQKPGENVSYEPQFIASYQFKTDSKVNVSIDGKKYVMFTRGTSAWLENAAEEPALVTAMKSGSDMSVNAVSGRGNETSYTFSLKGITAALDSISDCK
jgi:invasion protein IalB